MSYTALGFEETFLEYLETVVGLMCLTQKARLLFSYYY